MQLNPLPLLKHYSPMPTCNRASGNYRRQCASIIDLKAGLCDPKFHSHSQQHGLGTAIQWNCLVHKKDPFSSSMSLIVLQKKRGHEIKIPVFCAFNLPLTLDSSPRHTGAFTYKLDTVLIRHNQVPGLKSKIGRHWVAPCSD